MLGEMVDHQFDTAPGAPVQPGQVLGWIEGFKAISDVVCPGEGAFVGGNPALEDDITLVNTASYAEGWLYEMNGRLEEPSLDVQGYADFLKATINRLLAQQAAEEAPPPAAAL